MSQDVEQPAGGYDRVQAQQKWQAFWEKDQTFKPLDDGSKERRYVLDMFPYPSGDLHMGHAEAFAMGDIPARFWRLRGYDVMHPIGWDSFGLPAENAAIKADTHPAEWTYKNIETQANSFKRYGLSLDWSRRLHTSDEEYYRWTQWLFNRFFEKGLAYRKDSFVNWCPQDQTVLANEQVVNGKCERCSAEVTKRNLNQWYFKITDYADQLLEDMSQIEGGWPDHVLAMQRNWIGRSVGAHVKFQVEGRQEPITVFTTRADTLFGATFMVVAPDAALAAELVTDEQRPAFEAYLEQVKKQTEIERQSAEHTKTGVWLGVYATNPVNGEQLPVWAADYVLAEYGTGAIMAVPAHDQRDFDFAKTFNLPIRMVIDVDGTDPVETGIPTAGDGVYVNSGLLNGLQDKQTANAKMIQQLEADGLGSGTVQYRLRDWLLSRQRFWGCPIPIVHCPSCGEVPVPEDQLPVRLPDLRGAELAPKGTSPLASATEWVNTTCPKCAGPAKRDTDTMDTFVDSSWYFLRYCSPGYDKGPFDPQAVANWMPLAQYVGGVEHAILHLLYMRFFCKVLRDLGLLEFDEPMQRLLNQGQVINGGKAMSKSLGNGVDLGEQIDSYGVDAIRLTVVFAGPPEDDIDWADLSPASSLKFLQRAYRLATDVSSGTDVDLASGNLELRKITHKMIAEITMLIESQRYNVAVARTMELVNATRKAIDGTVGAADPAVREAVMFIAQSLSLVTPYVAEEMWETLGLPPSIANSIWPTADPQLTTEDTATMVVQVQGKIRAKLEVAADIDEAAALELALADAGVQRSLEGRPVVKVIARLPKLLSLVPGK